MDHLEGRVVLHLCGCRCGGAPAAWGLPLLPPDVLWPRRAAGPSDWLPQSFKPALSFLLVSYMPLGLAQLIGEKSLRRRANCRVLSVLRVICAQLLAADASFAAQAPLRQFLHPAICQRSKRARPSTARALV